MISFISLNQKFIDICKKHNYNAHCIKIQDYKPTKKFVFYVSPANTFGFMDGGIDFALSRIVFPGIEKIVKENIKKYGKTTLLGRPYLPIGSSLLIKTEKENHFLISAPTMLLPQKVDETQNCYYATMTTLYNVFMRDFDLNDVEIILTSMCCGWGKMTEEESFSQIQRAIKDYKQYKPVVKDIAVLLEPNLDKQPKYYQNTEWFDIKPNELVFP